MRLLYLGDTASPHFQSWVRYFADRAHDVHVCHVARGSSGALDGVVMHPAPRAMGASVRGAWQLAALEVRRLTRGLRPAVVHSHLALPAGYLGALAGARPHVVTAWGSEVLLASRRGRRKLARTARSADLLTADSHHLLDALRGLGAPAERLRWVTWGVDAGWLSVAEGVSRSEAAAELGLAADRPLVLSHRGVRDVYRPETVIRALAEVREAVPRVLGLVIYEAGREAELRRLEELAAELGVSDSVRFMPRVAQARMPLVYRAAGVCVSVPVSDSAPTSVFEALALGVPAVVSDLPWLKEPVHREARVRSVPVGDHVSLGKEIVEALLGSAPADAEANRRLVREHFNRDVVFARVEEEYRRLAAG